MFLWEIIYIYWAKAHSSTYDYIVNKKHSNIAWLTVREWSDEREELGWDICFVNYDFGTVLYFNNLSSICIFWDWGCAKYDLSPYNDKYDYS